MHTLVIDTSYGSAVGIVGREPIIETDSRTHVERLQGNIAAAVQQAGLTPADIDRIVVGIGPAPFTGLRAGIVAAKALAFATGATLVGQDILAPQALMVRLARQKNGPLAECAFLEGLHVGDVDAAESGESRHLTLAVNDARRKQLYFALYDDVDAADDLYQQTATLIDMDIDYPDNITACVNDIVERLNAANPNQCIIVDIAGHGARKYAAAWDALTARGAIIDQSLLDAGAEGLAAFAQLGEHGEPDTPIEPLYLRRPDVSIPNPLKHVLGHAGATKAER